MEKEKEKERIRREYLMGLKKEENTVVPNHKYVKNFSHLIAIINNALDHDVFKSYLDDHHLTLDNACTDAKFYYENVYKQPYCDQFTWLITHERPDLLIPHVLEMETNMYFKTNRFCGKLYGKIVIDIPQELIGK